MRVSVHAFPLTTARHPPVRLRCDDADGERRRRQAAARGDPAGCVDREQHGVTGGEGCHQSEAGIAPESTDSEPRI